MARLMRGPGRNRIPQFHALRSTVHGSGLSRSTQATIGSKTSRSTPCTCELERFHLKCPQAKIEGASAGFAPSPQYCRRMRITTRNRHRTPVASAHPSRDFSEDPQKTSLAPLLHQVTSRQSNPQSVSLAITVKASLPSQRTWVPVSLLPCRDPKLKEPPTQDMLSSTKSSRSVSKGSPPVKKNTLLDASGSFDTVFGTISALNRQHNDQSSMRKDISSLVVGGLKLIVDMAKRFADFFDTLSETMEKLRTQVELLSGYAKLYLHYSKVKEALSVAYGDLVDFITFTCRIFMNPDGTLADRISGKVLAKQLLDPSESRLRSMQFQFDQHLAMVKDISSLLEQERKLELEKDAERSALLAWLSKLRPKDDLDRIYKNWKAETGQWFLDSDEVQAWFQSDKPCLLWCHGSAGVGKSVLASILLKQKVLPIQNSKENVGISFFYFNFQSQGTQTPKDVIATLIKQLCQTLEKLEDFPQSLRELFQKCTKNDESPTLTELESEFQRLLGIFKTVFIVLDALDGSPKGNRKELNSLFHIMKNSSTRMKIFVTSRPESDIRAAFEEAQFGMLQIEAVKVNRDIATYVEHELTHRRQTHCNIGPALQEEIKTTLLTDSNGMFLWARCQLDYIYEQPSAKDVVDALKSLPSDMEGTYQRMMDKLKQQPPAMRLLGERALMWVVWALRPLRPKELAVAVAIEGPSESAEEWHERYTPETVVQSCCGFLSDDGGIVRPIHFTVQEFLKEKAGLRAGNEANMSLAEACVRYVLSDAAKRRSSQKFLGVHSFVLYYPYLSWAHHVRDVGLPLPQDLRTLVDKLLKKEYAVNRSLAHAIYRANGMVQSYEWSQLAGSESPLILCASLDLLDVYRELSGGSIDVLSMDFKEAIHEAAKTGSVSTIKTLVASGCPVDRPNSAGEYPMFNAAKYNRKDALQLFIHCGADTNARNEESGETALQVAAHCGHEDIVKILLEHGADVNIQGGLYRTALHAAVYKGSVEIVKLLLDHGAEANIQGGAYATALQAAACHGYEDIVKILLDDGADVNVQGGEYDTALHAAAHHGYEDIVKILLDHGADVNIQGGKYGTALQAACAWPRVSTGATELHLEPGAEGGATQQVATYQRYENIVTILLDHKADVNIEGGQFGTALRAGRAMGHSTIVELLLRHGADVNL